MLNLKIHIKLNQHLPLLYLIKNLFLSNIIKLYTLDPYEANPNKPTIKYNVVPIEKPAIVDITKFLSFGVIIPLKIGNRLNYQL